MPEVNEAVNKDGITVRKGDTGRVLGEGGKPYWVKEMFQMSTTNACWLKVRQPNARGRDREILLDYFIPDKQTEITLQPLPPQFDQADEAVRNKKFGEHGST